MREGGKDKQEEKLLLSVTINTALPKGGPQNLHFRSWLWHHGPVLGHVTGHLCVITAVSSWCFGCALLPGAHHCLHKSQRTRSTVSTLSHQTFSTRRIPLADTTAKISVCVQGWHRRGMCSISWLQENLSFDMHQRATPALGSDTVADIEFWTVHCL